MSIRELEVTRRSALQAILAGSGATGVSCWPFSSALSTELLGAKKRSLILLWQDGGPSHFETFDPKSLAPAEFRGELDSIPTALPGIRFCEVLPRLAGLANRLCVIRSLHQPSSGHVDGSHNVLTGWYGETESGKSRYPDLASVISHMRRTAADAGISIGTSTDPRLAKGMRGFGSHLEPGVGSRLPGYIEISKGLHRGGPAFLGPLCGPFQVAGDPSKPGFVIQNLDTSGSAGRLQDRLQIRSSLDRLGERLTRSTAGFEKLHAIDGFHQQAVELLAGGAAGRAFDLSREAPESRLRYGQHLAGQQCLLARRLVEAGVGVVTVRFAPDGRGDYEKSGIGWDDHAVHGNIFAIMRKRGPQFDQSVSALIEDLELRGMQDDVLLVVVGEFGRTPRVHIHKGCPGREHWGPAGCALVFGGGLRMGQVIGSTTDKGERPLDRPVSYRDLLATIYHSVGINPAQTFINPAGRRVPVLPSGEPIAELVSPAGDARRITGQSELDSGFVRAGRSAALSRPAAPLDDEFLKLQPGATSAQLAAHPLLDRAEFLVAHDTAIDDDGLKSLAHCRNLKRLHLNGTRITDAGLAHLSQLSNLEELILTGTQVSDAGLVQLKSLTRLKRIAFNGTGMTLPGVIRLFVEFQQRSIGDALTAMGLATRDNQGQVAAVNVAGTSFGDQEMQYIPQLSELKELHIVATRVTDAGMPHVRKLRKLEQLYLARCDIGDTGLSSISGLRKLRTINIYGTQVTSTGLEHLMDLTELQHLLITDLKLKPAVVDRLKSQLPRLNVTDFTRV